MKDKTPFPVLPAMSHIQSIEDLFAIEAKINRIAFVLLSDGKDNEEYIISMFSTSFLHTSCSMNKFMAQCINQITGLWCSPGAPVSSANKELKPRYI